MGFEARKRISAEGVRDIQKFVLDSVFSVFTFIPLLGSHKFSFRNCSIAE